MGCANAGWSAVSSALANATLAGVLAGFVLNGIVVMLSRSMTDIVQVRALALLFAAFVALGLDSYLFGLVSGDSSCNRAWTEAMLAAGLLGIGAIAIIAGFGLLVAEYINQSDRDSAALLKTLFGWLRFGVALVVLGLLAMTTWNYLFAVLGRQVPKYAKDLLLAYFGIGVVVLAVIIVVALLPGKWTKKLADATAKATTWLARLLPRPAAVIRTAADWLVGSHQFKQKVNRAIYSSLAYAVVSVLAAAYFAATSPRHWNHPTALVTAAFVATAVWVMVVLLVPLFYLVLGCSPPFGDAEVLPRSAAMNAGEVKTPPPGVLRRVLGEQAGLDVASLEATGRGESRTTFWVRDRAGRVSVLKVGSYAPGASERLRALHPVLAGLRALDYPAPEISAIGHLPGLVFWVQPRLPGSILDRGQRPPDYRLMRRLLPEVMRLNDAQAGLGVTPGGWRSLITETLTTGGDGYCLHSTLAASPLTRDLLPVLRRIGEQFCPDIPAGEDFVHYDFTPANLLTDGETITGVIDINPPLLAGDRAFDLATLLFYLYDHDEIRDRLGGRLRELAEPKVAAAYLAHMVLRQVDWSLRYHPGALATRRHLRLARLVVADINEGFRR